MDRVSLLLSAAIVFIALSYILYTGQQYFSVASMAIVFLIALSSALIILVLHWCRASNYVFGIKADRLAILSVIAVAGLVLFEVYFDGIAHTAYSQIPVILLLSSGAVAASIAGMYALMRLTNGMKSYRFWITVIIGVAIISVASYSVMYSFRSVNWNGIDELAYNYYSSYLFAHGINPYTASMQPILQQRNIFPTVQLNGTFEYAYDYPAFSFLPYLFMPILGISNFFAFIIILIFLSVLMGYVIYRRSGYNKLALIPIGVWLMITYTLVGTVNQYLAVSVLFLLAYLERKRAIVSGILIGLSASIVQLAWFAIPFFFILAYREHGSAHTARCIGFAVLAFLLVNGYFLLLSPRAFVGNVFAVFGLSKLVVFGPNIMQLLVSYYPVHSWYPAALSISTIIALLGAFYLYTDTLRPLIAVAPIMVFFLAWRNISIYGIPFIPVIIAIYYVKEDSAAKDIIRSKKPMLYALGAILAVFASLAILSHASYSNSGSFRIEKITPIIYGKAGFVGPFSLGGVIVTVRSNVDYPQPLSFYIVSRDPGGYEYILNSSLNSTLEPNSSLNYTLRYQLALVNGNTTLYVSAFNQYYIESERYRISVP
ncbi:MAG: hypothetical protein KGI06_00835 [Candidatus Micrarchaeota archaeon]|nr:hypothetical protein [Candidatus Micrarchaeota archaeon]